MIYLPSYSPNLNLIERLWKFFKKKVMYNKYYDTLSDFENAIDDLTASDYRVNSRDLRNRSIGFRCVKDIVEAETSQ